MSNNQLLTLIYMSLIWNFGLTALIFILHFQILNLKDLIDRLDNRLFDTKIDLDVLEKQTFEIYKETRKLEEID